MASLRLESLAKSLTGESRASAAFYGLALILGVLIRAAAVSRGDGFPLNDGGMFLSMVNDLKRADFIPPIYTSYNGGDIPFAYPPLGFYLAAGLSELGGWPAIDLLIVLPLFFSILTVPAFFLLARSVLEKPLLASLATLVFACIPRSFNWEIVGGGLTRSPGLFFATLALWQVYELFHSGNRRRLGPAILLSSLTVLSHMEMGWFLAFSTAFFVAWHYRDTGTFRHALFLAAGVALVTAPWWLSVLVRLGVDPFLAAIQTGGHSPSALVRPLFLNFTEDSFFPVGLILGMLGLLAALRDRRYLLPAWLLLIFLLDPRKAPTTATLPLAMLAAVGVVEVLWPLMKNRADGQAPRWAYLATGFLLTVYAPIAAIGSIFALNSPVHGLSEQRRASINWVANNTEPSARFLVLPSADRWATDSSMEWFPALSGRVSVATVQGSEWLGNSTYQGRQEAYSDLSECVGKDVACIEAWALESGASYSHIFVPKSEAPGTRAFINRQQLECCMPLLTSLRTSTSFSLVYENDGAVIFERHRE